MMDIRFNLKQFFTIKIKITQKECAGFYLVGCIFTRAFFVLRKLREGISGVILPKV